MPLRDNTRLLGVFMSYQRSFPRVAGSNLDGAKFNLPNDFEGDLAIILIAFRREQTVLIEGWTSCLEDLVKKYPGLRYYELPVLSTSYSPFRWWIVGGMKAGIVDEMARRRTITVYTRKRVFKSQLGILSEETIYVLLVGRKGKVFLRLEGEFTEEKSHQLQNATSQLFDK